jgi:hypothetical protein
MTRLVEAQADVLSKPLTQFHWLRQGQVVWMSLLCNSFPW